MPAARSICLYTPSTDPSGMGQHMLDLLAEYTGSAEVSLMVRPTPGGRRMLDRAAALGARPVPLPGPRDPAFARVVTGVLGETRPDVFHVHVGTGSEDWDGARLARAAGCPAVVQTQHLPYLLSSPRRRAGLFHGIETVDRLIAVSEGVRRTYERIGVPPGRMTVVPNGVAALPDRPDRPAARRALGLPPDVPVVLTVGRLTHMKGQQTLIEAAPLLRERHPGVQIVLLGDGPLRERLTRQAAGLGLAGVVRLPGCRPGARALLTAADVFVLPSRCEGMPLAALEAMEAGLPVVGTRVTGTEEVVRDGVTGALVPPGDPRALAAALSALLDDPVLRRRQGAAGHRAWRDHHRLGLMAARTAAVYERTLTSAAGVPR
ncbi:glycosyltransferase family 4 protein [Blastococcus sp. SYSU D00820]